MTKAKLWGGRFQQATDPRLERFSASIHFDRALAGFDVRGSIAHARMLGAQGIIPEGDVKALVSGLDTILREIEAGSFPFDPALEDIHMNVEARLGELIGPVAGRHGPRRTALDRDALVDVDAVVHRWWTLRRVGVAVAEEEVLRVAVQVGVEHLG